MLEKRRAGSRMPRAKPESSAFYMKGLFSERVDRLNDPYWSVWQPADRLCAIQNLKAAELLCIQLGLALLL